MLNDVEATVSMNNWMDAIYGCKSVRELETLYGDLLWYYRAQEFASMPWEHAAVAYHDVTEDHHGFTVLLHAARKREWLEDYAVAA